MNPIMSRTAALALLTISLAACKGNDKAGPGGMGGPGGAMPPPEVGVVTLQPASIPLEESVSGRLAPYRSADVRARVPGIMQRRLYKEGSDVSQGQALFQIDPATLTANTAAARAALAKAMADSANAHATANRARQLAPGRFISKSDLDNALAAERSANAAVLGARAALGASQINLGYATVRAPIPGRAGIAQVTEGALVGQDAATLLTTVDQIDPLYVVFSLPSGELAELRKLSDGATSREVQVVLPDGSVFPQAAHLDFSGDVVDPSTGGVQLRAVLPNPQHVLLPGTFVTLKATLANTREAYRIPQTAVQRDGQGAYVLVVGTDGKAMRKDINPERQQGSDWIVTKGVAPGDRVIVSGLQRIQQPGQAVKAVPADAEAATPGQPQAAPAKQG